MKLYCVLFISLLISGYRCFPESHSDGGDAHELTIQDVYEALQLTSDRMKGVLEHKLGELRDIALTVNGPKLDGIIQLLETIKRHQNFIKVCVLRDDVCGQHGRCDLSADGESRQCHCEEGYAGERCEISDPCKVELYIANQLPPMPGRQYPVCADDGGFADVQFIGSWAYCVTQSNEEINGYGADIWKAEEMTCQCARDEVTSGQSLNCLANGSYPPIACDWEQCWCQDAHGHAQSTQAVLLQERDLLVC